jgi:hypothetical protein
MFIDLHVFSLLPQRAEMPSISLFAEMIRGNRVAKNISPLCGDDSVHILQRANRRTFEAKPTRTLLVHCGLQ